MRMESSLRILLADDHDIVRQGLKALLEREAGWSVCAEAATGRDAVTLALEHRPDVAILDMSMPGLTGIEAARRIRQAVPDAEILLFTMHENEELVRESLEAGVRGYLLKSEAVDQIVPAVRSLSRHKPYFTGRISEIVLHGYLEGGAEAAPVRQVTSREREVIQLLAEGKSNKQIATALELSVKTVETHRAAIMRKLKLSSLAELVRYAIRNNIVQP
jgi:DNA-binding NarL/FixJ family response regulator